MEPYPDNIILSLDCKNAFNSVDRRAIREEIIKHFPSMISFFDWTYGSSTKLYDDKGNYLFDSRCGVKQGDSMSAFWFSLATLPILKSASKRFRNTTILAIMDDVNIMGIDEDVLECFDFITNEWRNLK